MRRNGFTLIELLAVIVVLGIIMLIAVTAVNNVINNARTSALAKDEKMLIKAAQNYLSAGVVNYPSNIGDTVEVRLSDLESNGYIERIKSPSNQSVECDGYLIVTKIEIGKYDYTPHLDCLNGIGSASEDALLAHYTFDDFQEPTTNIFPRNHQNAAFTDAFNGSNYGFGSATNIQQIIDNSLRWDDRSAATKVSRINSGVSQRDYVAVYMPSDINTTRVLSFWYYGTYGTTINPYNNDSSADLYYLDDNGNWIGGTASVNIPVPQNQWKKIIIKIVNRGAISGTGFSWMTLHSNQTTTTLNNTEYWAFTLFQYEEKSYVTDFVVGSRTGTVKDYSGNMNNINMTLSSTPKWISSNTGGAYEFDGIADYLILNNFNHNILKPGSESGTWTFSVWTKPNGGQSGSEKMIVGRMGCHGGIYASSSDFSFAVRSDQCFTNSASITYTPSSMTNWENLVAVYNNRNMSFYANGKLISQNTFSSTIHDYNNDLYIGGIPSNYYYKGIIDDVKIHNRALSSNEILQNYTLDSYKINNS